MKKRIHLLILPLVVLFSANTFCAEIPSVYISPGSAVHFRSPEPISYVDLPKSRFSGDLPLKNLLRLRLTEAGALMGEDQAADGLGILTITGEHFFAQYQLKRATGLQKADSEVEILPAHMLPLIPDLPTLSTSQLHQKSIALVAMREKKPIATAKNQGVRLQVNQIKCAGEFIFLDLGITNETALSYELEQLSFTVTDKKIIRASNFQSFEVIPKFSLASLERFSHQARNIYVLPRMSFSAAKRLKITLSEKQPSSRSVTLELDYGQLLAADSF